MRGSPGRLIPARYIPFFFFFFLATEMVFYFLVAYGINMGNQEGDG